MTSESKKCPWKNGYWSDVKEKNNLTFVDGENVENINHAYIDYPELKPETTIEAKKGTWTYGDFGPAPAEIVELAGLPNFNIQVQLSGEDNEITFKLILNEQGTRVYGPGFVPYISSQKYIIMEWLSEQKLNEFKESRQAADALICPYAKIQPGNLGKIVWFSGPPGSGKSTSAQMLGRKHGYVFYEGDCIMQSLSPFIDLNVEEPTMVQNEQIPLKVIQI